MHRNTARRERATERVLPRAGVNDGRDVHLMTPLAQTPSQSQHDLLEASELCRRHDMKDYHGLAGCRSRAAPRPPAVVAPALQGMIFDELGDCRSGEPLACCRAIPMASRKRTS